MKKKLLGLFLVCLCLCLVLCGCGASDTSKVVDDSGVSGTDDTATPDSDSDGAETAAFDYSSALDENGFFKDVKALDYVTLPDYKGVTVPDTVLTASDADLQSQIDYILQNNPVSTAAEPRAIEDGDTVNIDYVGTVDGVEFSGGNTNGAGTEVTIGVTSYIDDFLEQLIGHEPGENFDIEVTFPDPYQNNTELSGKDAVFNVTINHLVEETVLTELTADIAATYGFATVDELKQSIRDFIISNQKDQYFSDIITNAQCKEIPADIIQYLSDSVLAEYELYAAYYQTDVETLIKSQGYESVDAFLEASADTIQNAAHDYFVIQAIAEQEGLAVSDEDVNSSDNASQIETYGIPYLKQYMLQDVVFNFVYDNAK